MKIIKLAGIFVVLLGGIILALSIINPVPGGENPDPDKETLLEQYSREITDSWNGLTEWDSQLFTGNCNKIEALNNDYSASQVSVLREANITRAIEFLEKKIFDEWHSANCSKQKINTYYNAITKEVCKVDEGAKNNPTVMEIKEVYNVYCQALNLAINALVPNSKFNGETWQSYADYQDDIDRDIRTLKQNSRYRSHLSNITSINNGLNNVDNRFDLGRRKYYKQLCNEIIAYYDRIPTDERSYDDLSKLRAVRNMMRNEHRDSYSIISKYTEQFHDDVAENNRAAQSDASTTVNR